MRRHFLTTASLTTAAVALLAATAAAHHIMGIPHYAYDEAYPQAPVITYAVEAGPYLVKVTGYPGKPVPGELTEVRAYIVHTDDPDSVYDGPVEARVERDGLFGPSVAWGPGATRFDENLHKLSPTYPEDGHYRIRLELQLEGQPYEIDFPIVVGEPSSPAAVLLGFAGSILALVVLVRAARIKLERRQAPLAETV